jgi:hypothetical protein
MKNGNFMRVTYAVKDDINIKNTPQILITKTSIVPYPIQHTRKHRHSNTGSQYGVSKLIYVRVMCRYTTQCQ